MTALVVTFFSVCVQIIAVVFILLLLFVCFYVIDQVLPEGIFQGSVTGQILAL